MGRDEAGKKPRQHGLDFALIEAFDWEQAIIEKDERRDYAEERYRALGYTVTACMPPFLRSA